MSLSNSRRDFLKTGSALIAGASLALPKFAAAQAQGEDFWRMVRAQFAFSDHRVPMNAANLCPSFRAVADNVSMLTSDIDIDCSFNNRAKFGDILEAGRAGIASQLGVSSDEVALVRNTSEANNIINNGLDLKAGDEVVIWDQNHPTNNVAWDVRAERYGIRVKRVSVPTNPTSQQELIDPFVDALSNRTRVLAITQISNVSGIQLPVAEIGKAANARDIHFHVDGAQSWGALHLDLKALGADSFSASAHKWFMGPKEVGLLYVKAEKLDSIWPNVVAPGWGNDAETDLVGARKLESLGQRDDAALGGLTIAAQLHGEIGLARIEQRVEYLAQRLKEGISEAGLTLVTPMDATLSHGVCITAAPAGQGGTINNRLYSEFGIAGAPTGGVRLCPTIYNTADHVDRAIEGLKTIMT